MIGTGRAALSNMVPRWTAVAVLLAVTVGCGSLPTTHYYLLEPQNMAAHPHHRPGVSIGVAPFQVDSPYDQDRIVYRVGSTSAEVGYYAYHRWAAPLSRMLPRVVAGAFGNLPGVATIEPQATGRDYDATLHGRVVALEEVDSSSGAGVHLVLTLTLLDPQGTKLWSRSLTSPKTAETTDEVSEVVTRMQSALQRMLGTAGPDLQRSLPDPS
jgi:uncharacterized lipoprotein YmbA